MATDIHLPVETSPVSKTATYLTIWTIGAHDLYKFDPNGTIQILKQKPPQKFENINITEDIRLQDLKKSIDMEPVIRPDLDDITRVVAQCESKFFAKDEKVIDVFTMIGNTFKGHVTGTCGHYCLLTNLALLSESILKKSDTITITFNEESGLTKLTLDQFTNTADDAITEKEKGNQEKINAWLTDNEQKLKAQNPDDPTLAVFEQLIKKLQNPNWLESEEIKYVIQKVTELTGKQKSFLDPEIVNIQQAVNVALTVNQDAINTALTVNQDAINAARSVTPENAAEKLQALKDSKKLKTIVNLEGVTTDDIAIIGLLTAFLTVLGGPAIPATIASIILLSKALRMHNIEITDDDIAKITPPQTTTKHPEGQQVAKETSHHLAAAA
jgi:hypothetical protein